MILETKTQANMIEKATQATRDETVSKRLTSTHLLL